MLYGDLIGIIVPYSLLTLSKLNDECSAWAALDLMGGWYKILLECSLNLDVLARVCKSYP